MYGGMIAVEMFVFIRDHSRGRFFWSVLVFLAEVWCVFSFILI